MSSVAAWAAALLTISATVIGCGSRNQAETGTPRAQQPTTAQTAKAYPLDWCIVSGEKLGGMGAPVTYTYHGREVRFCCKGCIRDFESEPARYLARLDSAVAGQIQRPRGEDADHGG